MTTAQDTSVTPLAELDEALADVWDAYQGRRGTTERNRLVVAYAPIVKFVAGRMAVQLSSAVELEDLVGYGMLGLIEAVERFDPGRGLKFTTYASHRIRGAILDELRRTDWAPRRLRKRLRHAETVRERLSQELGRSPHDDELSAGIGESAHDLRTDAARSKLVRLDNTDESGAAVASQVGGDDPELAAVENRRFVAWLLDTLGPRDRQIVTLYFLEGRSLAEIGAVLGITESRVCQLMARIKRELAARTETAAATPPAVRGLRPRATEPELALTG